MALRAPTLNASLTSSSLGVREHAQEADRARRAEQEGSSRPMKAWAVLVPERGAPLDLEQFPFQKEWYSETIARAREVVWMKAAQVGMSAYAIRWAMRRAEQFGDRVIYFFPTDDDVTDFGDQRIEPSIQDSPFLLKRIPAHFVRHKHLKQIGAGDLSLKGTQSRSAVQSVDADALVFDEYEYLNQKNLAQAERRLAGAKAAGREPRIRRLGYPILPGDGISALYERSDKRVWHVTCPVCDEVQPLTWEDNMRWRTYAHSDEMRMGSDEYEDYRVVHEAWRACKECNASLEPADGETIGPIHRGEWVRTQPDSDLIGFHVSRLIVPRTDLEELVQNSRKTSPSDQEAFWNNDLGLPYAPAEAALTHDDLDRACSFGGELQSGYRGRNLVTAGVDVHSEYALNMRISEKMPSGERRALYIGEPENFNEVLQLLIAFRVDCAVIDSMPDRRLGRGVAARLPGRVHLCEYDDNPRSDALVFNQKKNIVRVNRTEAIDAMMDSIRHGRNIPLKMERPRWRSQMLAPKRRTVEDAQGRPKRVYDSTGPDGDHYAHAEVYDLVADQMLTLRGMASKSEAAAAGQTVDKEELGTQRGRGIDDYSPGFRGGTGVGRRY